MKTYLFMYLCLSWDSMGCANEEKFQIEGPFFGPAAVVWCDTRRDLAQATLRERQHRGERPSPRRFECESEPVGE